MTGSQSAGTLRGMISTARRERFVGRSAEIDLVQAALEADEPPFSLLYIHGPAGIGKSSLLGVLEEVAATAGACVVRMDGRDVTSSSAAFLRAAETSLAVPDGDEPITLRTPAGSDRLALLLDSYEQFASIDDWLRTALLPRLPASTMIIIAGRRPPAAAWRTDTGWAERLRVISLRNLRPEDTLTYLRRRRVAPQLQDRILQACYGHPLGMALMTDVCLRDGELPGDLLDPDVVQELVSAFVTAVPGAQHRHALIACAIARTTTETLLREVVHADHAPALFGWLRQLSFVDAGEDGLFPHDLARDALDADARWRDFDEYASVFRAVHRQLVATVRTSRGQHQLRAIADLKFLFRHLRGVLSPVDWEQWGQFYPDRARAEDRQPILTMISDWEGAESAAIARRWLDRQPDAFFVIRADGAVRGVLAVLNLTRAAVGDLDADPAARAAMEFAGASAPLRAGEQVTLCRYVIDAEQYQDPSPTLNVTPVLTLQQQLGTPRLAWDFVALAGPDDWNDYFAAADLPRATGADFVVGGRTYGLFGHDFRRISVEAMIRRWVERALARDPEVAMPESEPELLVLSEPDFEAAVRRALRDLRQPELLGRNPLLRTGLLADRAPGGAADAAALDRLLREAIAALAVDPRDDNLLRAVDQTFLRSSGTQEAAAAALRLPFSTYRRHLGRGVSKIIAWLWDRELGRNEQK